MTYALKNKPRSLADSGTTWLWPCYSAIVIVLLSQVLTYSQADNKHLHEVSSYSQVPKHRESFYFHDSFSEVGKQFYKSHPVDFLSHLNFQI